MAKRIESEWFKGLKAAEACYNLYIEYEEAFSAEVNAKRFDHAIGFLKEEMDIVQMFESEERLAGWSDFVDHAQNRLRRDK